MAKTCSTCKKVLERLEDVLCEHDGNNLHDIKDGVFRYRYHGYDSACDEYEAPEITNLGHFFGTAEAAARSIAELRGIEVEGETSALESYGKFLEDLSKDNFELSPEELIEEWLDAPWSEK